MVGDLTFQVRALLVAVILLPGIAIAVGGPNPGHPSAPADRSTIGSTTTSLKGTPATNSALADLGRPTAVAGPHCSSGGSKPAPCALPRPGAAGTPIWTNLTTTASPAANFWVYPIYESNPVRNSMVYDSSDGYDLLFDGSSTWVYRGGSWENLTSNLTTSPADRVAMTLVDDPADGYVLAWGGWSLSASCPGAGVVNGEGCNDSWAFHNGGWSRLNTTCSYLGSGVGSCAQMVAGGSQGSEPAPAAFDGACACVVIEPMGPVDHTTATWSYKAGVWTDWTPNYTGHGPVIGSLAYDPVDGYLVAFGDDGRVSYAHEYPPNAETWTWTNGTWTNRTAQVGSGPSARYDPALAWDSRAGSLLLFGGWTMTCTAWSGTTCLSGTKQTLSDSWTYLNGSWTSIAAAFHPGGRASADLVDDVRDGAEILFGGWSCAMPCPLNWTDYSYASDQRLNETWAWSGAPPFGELVASTNPNSTEVGFPVSYSARLPGGTPPIIYNWSFGDGSSNLSQTTIHVYRSIANFTILLAVSDSIGRSRNASLHVQVVAGIGATVAVSPNPADVGVKIEFASSIAGGVEPYSYRWTFGDGQSSTVSGPSHLYNTSGRYRATLVISDAVGGLQNASALVYVNPSLTVSNVTASPLPTVLGRPVNFSATIAGGTSPVTLSWLFGDGGTGGNLTSITHFYTTNGPFVAWATAIDADGERATGSLNITVALNASAFGNTSLGATPLEVGFSSSVLGGDPAYSYTWTFGDGATSAAAQPSHRYSTPGSFSALLAVTDASGQRAESRWNVSVLMGGTPLSISLAATPLNVGLGANTRVVAEPSGGMGRYLIEWPTVPAGCVQVTLEALQCSFTAAGSYLVGASIQDATGVHADASLRIAAGSSAVVPPPSGPAGVGNAAGWWTIGAILVIGTAAGFAVGRYLRRPVEFPPRGGSDRYSAYRSGRGKASGTRRGGDDERTDGLL